MFSAVVKDTKRYAHVLFVSDHFADVHSTRNILVIDCAQLQKASSDSQLVTILAKQCGYWPVFSFLNSLNHLIDLASVGMIGQKCMFCCF